MNFKLLFRHHCRIEGAVIYFANTINESFRLGINESDNNNIKTPNTGSNKVNNVKKATSWIKDLS